MSLSVSQSRFKQTGTATSALTLTLLLSSLAVYAGSSQVDEETADRAQSSGQSSQWQMQETGAQATGYPRWPQHRQGNEVIIPPPPPGPYNSSALSDYSVIAPVHHARKPAPRRPAEYNSPVNEPAAVPMATFSPDRPWPKNLRPEPRQPDYRAPAKASRPARPSYAPMGNRHYAQGAKAYQGPYMGAPRMNAPRMNSSRMNNMGMNSSRWMPNMTMTPPGPYNNRLNYAPDYGSNYGPQNYSRPAINNNATRSANPAYR